VLASGVSEEVSVESVDASPQPMVANEKPKTAIRVSDRPIFEMSLMGFSFCEMNASLELKGLSPYLVGWYGTGSRCSTDTVSSKQPGYLDVRLNWLY
jgi:hypothetical protein